MIWAAQSQSKPESIPTETRDQNPALLEKEAPNLIESRRALLEGSDSDTLPNRSRARFSQSWWIGVRCSHPWRFGVGASCAVLCYCSNFGEMSAQRAWILWQLVCGCWTTPTHAEPHRGPIHTIQHGCMAAREAHQFWRNAPRVQHKASDILLCCRQMLGWVIGAAHISLYQYLGIAQGTRVHSSLIAVYGYKLASRRRFYSGSLNLLNRVPIMKHGLKVWIIMKIPQPVLPNLQNCSIKIQEAQSVFGEKCGF